MAISHSKACAVAVPSKTVLLKRVLARSATISSNVWSALLWYSCHPLSAVMGHPLEGFSTCSRSFTTLIGSSVIKARVVTVSGVTWTFSEVSHSFGCGDHGGVGSLSTGSPSGRGSGRTPWLNVQSGHSKHWIKTFLEASGATSTAFLLQVVGRSVNLLTSSRAKTAML